MLDLYDVEDGGGQEEVPQSKLEAGFEVRPSDALEELALCQELLVLAKTQRALYPLTSRVGKTKATDVAKAELRLAHAYRRVGSLDQVCGFIGKSQDLFACSYNIDCTSLSAAHLTHSQSAWVPIRWARQLASHMPQVNPSCGGVVSDQHSHSPYCTSMSNPWTACSSNSRISLRCGQIGELGWVGWMQFFQV